MPDRLFRILTIEDNPADVLLLLEALELEGLRFKMDVVADGGDAVKLINREDVSPAPDLVILDLGLPSADGITVLKAIRQSRRFSDVPVVITSSPISTRHLAELQDLRIKLHFTKPTDVDAFLKIGEELKEILTEIDPITASAL